ncbi:MAG: hypothetical protein ACRDGJ_06545 [Candidatus Limnocylindria bacterium]
MLGPEGLYLLAKELQPRRRAVSSARADARLSLRVRIGRGLIGAGTAIGGERLEQGTGGPGLRGRPASPAA